MSNVVRRTAKVLALAVVFGGAAPVMAGLTTFHTYTGNVAVSTDGFGSTSNSGTISASVPVGATVLAAYLYSATYSFTSPVAPTGTLNGSPVAYGPLVTNGTACCNLSSARADVTSIVAPVINGGAGGVYNFAVTEGSSAIDGEALVVVYSEASLPEATVGILDGWASVSGDTTTINFGSPLDPTDPGFFAEMALGIGFSALNQASTVEVNGTLITRNAGDWDDGESEANGSLITVGGFDDPFSPFLPSRDEDHERYNLVPYISVGDTSIVVNTANASEDDNIFLTTFYVSGEATIEDPIPEPGTLTLLGLGLAGLAGRRRWFARRRDRP